MSATATSRRSLMAGAAAALAAGAAGRAEAATDFVLATFGGPYEKELRQSVLPGFDKANDVTTKLELGMGINFIQKLLASRNRPPYDVICCNEDEAMLGETAKLFATLDPAKLPNLPQVYDIMKPPAIPLYGTEIFELGCVYNSSKIAEPKSWEDLWKKGVTVAVAHPTNSYGMLFLVAAAKMNGGSETNLGPGFAQLKKLSNMKIYRGFVDGIALFRSGEADAGMFYRNRAIELADQGLPIRFTVPKEGSYGIRSGVQVPRNAANMQAAIAWVNMAMGVDYQKVFVPLYYSPSNETLKLPPAMAAKHIYGSEAVHRLNFADWKVLNPLKSEIYERWDKEFS